MTARGFQSFIAGISCKLPGLANPQIPAFTLRPFPPPNRPLKIPAVEQAILDKLDAFIRKKGLRKTPQRDAIVRTAFASDEHFTSEELFDRSRKANAGVSRATVYRTIALLV